MGMSDEAMRDRHMFMTPKQLAAEEAEFAALRRSLCFGRPADRNVTREEFAELSRRVDGLVALFERAARGGK